MRTAIIVAALLLVACSGHDGGAGAVTADEARQLNDAAAMLDANSVDLNAASTDDEPAAATTTDDRNAT